MKLSTLEFSGGLTVAIVDSALRLFWPIHEIYPEYWSGLTADIVSVIARLHGEPARVPSRTTGRPMAGQRMLAPILMPPRNIFCVGKNYRSHAHEFAKSGFDSGPSTPEPIPAEPIVFTKPWTAIAGPEDDILLWPTIDQAVDYEGELTVVIGKAGRRISKEAALDHVFGYTIMNDVTARDLQRDHKQWFLGKAVDGYAPIGPWIVTSDELALNDLRLQTIVNGEIRQDAKTCDLIFDVPTLVATISRGMQLLPGDVIATGTPDGVGIGFNPPKFLKDGDVVEVDITGIGRLRNVVRTAAAGSGSNAER